MFIEAILGIAGLTGLNLRLFPAGTDTPVNGAGDALAEQTNRQGCYRATVDEILTGLHEAYIFDGDGGLLAVGSVVLGDAGPYSIGVLAASEGAADVSGIPAAVWSHASRTLTMTAAQVQSVTQSGTRLTLRRGDTLTISLTGAGDLSAASLVWSTLKTRLSDADAEAQAVVNSADGLTVLAGASPGTGETATLTVTDAEAGNVTITLSAAAARKLTPTTTGVWDLQMRTAAGDVATLTEGRLTITADVTQAIE